jgi:hypothetical protein
MATYQQYSEVVAAYGYPLPPPEQPQVNRIGVALLYAAIGVALGTMTGTGMAVVSMQPGGVVGWAHRLTLPNFSGAAKTAQTAAQVPAAPVVAQTKTAPAPAPTQTMQAKTTAPVAPAPVQAKAVTPALAAPVHARATAPAETLAAAKAAAPAPAVHPGLLARVFSPSTVEASVDTRALQAPAATHPAAVNPRTASAPVKKPAVSLATLSTATALPIPSVVAVSLDEEVKPAAFYSEGDATVVDYDGTLGTILTNDGRTFIIGPTVTMSTATSWNDYRANVHYRCDQGGKCTLTRNGVIALNAKLI